MVTHNFNLAKMDRIIELNKRKSMNSFLNNKECFIHLRSHSSYSLSIGAIQITTLINLALEDNQPLWR